MKFFFRYLKFYKKECVISPLFKLLEACFDLLVPTVVAYIIDNGIGNGVNTDKSVIYRMFALLIVFAITGLSCTVIAQYFSARAAVGCATRVRHDLFEKMQSFSYPDTDKVGTSSMITRITSDVNQFQNGINMTLRLLLRSPIIVFGAVIMAFTVNVRLAWIFAVAVPILAVIVFAVIISTMPLYGKIQSRLDKVTAKTRSNLEGVRVVRAFGLENQEQNEFSVANDSHTKLQRFTGRITALMNPLTYVVVNLGVISIIYFGGVKANAGEATSGQIVALINYMSQILVELVKLANTIFTVTKATACANRLRDVLDSNTGLEKSQNQIKINVNSNTSVEFENVSFSYPGAQAETLSNICFRATPGMTVGIIGGTGSGKSTLVNLISRFYDATDGRVCVFGNDVKLYDETKLRSHIGIVPQKAVLFRGTVRSNLLWGSQSATDSELWEALKIAQADGFVKEKPLGLDEPVEEGGKNFSGGQKQRLTVARALVGNPQIMILDDSASALDFATDAALRKALKTLENTTTFIVSQRTSSIMHADLIIVLDDGHAVGMGCHRELLDSCDVYREIYQSQFKGGDTV